MKTRNIFALAVVMMSVNVMNAQVNNDDAAIRAFEQADSVFMSKNDKHAFYKDANLAYAGNSAQTSTLKERRNRGIFAGLDAGVNYTTDHCVPAVGITLGLLTNHWIGKINGDLLFGSKPYEASDDQSNYLGGSLDAMIGRCIADGKDHHSQLFITANIGYQRVRDYQNFGEWSAKSTEETPTEIITTTTKGKTDYMVNTSNMKYKAGFLYMYTPYNSNWAFMGEINAGTMGQLNGGHGVKYTFTADARISVVYKFATGTRTNKRAAEMIKY